MTIARLMLPAAALCLILGLASATLAQPGGGKQRPYPGGPPGGGAMRPYPGAGQGAKGKADPKNDKGRPEAPGEHGRRVAELKQKEAKGALTEEERQELEKLKQQRHKGKRREARQARLAELKQKEASGQLTDEEKAELEKLEKIQERHAKLKSKRQELKQNRLVRRRAARRKALAEFPGLLANESAIAEFGKHGQRMAKLERAREVAEAEGLDALVARIDKLMAQENKRHEQWVSKHAGGKP